MGSDEKGIQLMVLVVSTLLTNILLTVFNTVTLPFILVVDFFAPDRQV